MSEPKKKSWITRYGSPETRVQVEHDEDDCPACEAAEHLKADEILFVQIESEDGSIEIRRVRAFLSGFFRRSLVLNCRVVSREQADEEIARVATGEEIESGAEEMKKTSILGVSFDLLRMMFDPNAYAAEMGAYYGRKVSQHDPCEECGHGRLLHKRQAYVIEEHRRRDEALSATQCRHGHHQGGVPCPCPCWKGTETLLWVPEFRPGMEKRSSLAELLKTKKANEATTRTEDEHLERVEDEAMRDAKAKRTRDEGEKR